MEKEKIQEIRKEVFKLCQQAKNLEDLHWYIAVDDCFENDEFHNEDSGNLKWRIQVLYMKKEPINRLANLVTPLIILYKD